jgi:hypothetical protein
MIIVLNGQPMTEREFYHNAEIILENPIAKHWGLHRVAQCLRNVGCTVEIS